MFLSIHSNHNRQRVRLFILFLLIVLNIIYQISLFDSGFSQSSNENYSRECLFSDRVYSIAKFSTDFHSEVFRKSQRTVTNATYFNLNREFGDPYADAVITTHSLYYSSAENALGAPDGVYATIFLDYGNGFLTLDMGECEEILDDAGDDFTVVALQGEYMVYVTNNLDDSFTYLGTGINTTNFDLGSISLDMVRYIKIEYHAGNFVHLDAITAINYNQIDTIPPQINGLEDYWIWENQTQITLNWECSDFSPLNYSILVNGTPVESGVWEGSSISFTYLVPQNSNEIQVTLVLYDTFGNRAEDLVIIDIRTITTTSSSNSVPTPGYTSFVFLIALFVLILWYKKIDVSGGKEY